MNRALNAASAVGAMLLAVSVATDSLDGFTRPLATVVLIIAGISYAMDAYLGNRWI